MARSGSFRRSPLTGALSDLSVYQIGAAPVAAPLQPTPLPAPTYTPAAPPPVPTVAPGAGVLPQPAIPHPISPYVTLKAERSGIAARAVATGHTPTAAAVTATQVKNSSTALQAELDAIRARAIATGHTPTDSGVMATYLNNLARAG